MRDAVFPHIHRHQSAKGLQDRIHRRALAHRPPVTESGDRQIDRLWTDSAYFIIRKPQPVRDARPKILDEDIRIVNKLTERFFSLFTL